MALRRAQKPSALGDDVTAAINLLVRLLPLVQMVLMRHLYFQVTPLTAHSLCSRLYRGQNLQLSPMMLTYVMSCFVAL